MFHVIERCNLIMFHTYSRGIIADLMKHNISYSKSSIIVQDSQRDIKINIIY